MRAPRSLLFILLFGSACERPAQPDPHPATPADTAAREPAPATPAEERTIELYFSHAESTAVVSRSVADTAPPLALALNELLRGPSEEERRRGITSWFSAETAGLLRTVELAADGSATIDFTGLPGAIPGASSSAGSEQLLESLRRTTFQFPDVQSAEYRLDGSCEAFWNWLQRGCTIVRRSDTGSGGGLL